MIQGSELIKGFQRITEIWAGHESMIHRWTDRQRDSNMIAIEPPLTSTSGSLILIAINYSTDFRASFRNFDIGC